MLRLAKWLATAGGLGELPFAPGTAGSAAGLLIGLAWRQWTEAWPGSGLLTLLALAGGLLLGVFVSEITERQLAAHDPSCIVIDEVLGMWLVIAFCPSLNPPWLSAAVAFLAFRAFDIAKPPPLKLLARCPGGWGILLDDVGAAVYALGIVWAVSRLF